MTPTAWIGLAAVFLTFVLNGAAWLYALGRWSKALEAMETSVATKAPLEAFREVEGRVDVLEKDMREVVEFKQALKSHADLTSAKFDSISQQMKDGFALVGSEQRSFDRLVSKQLEEVTHRLRERAN